MGCKERLERLRYKMSEKKLDGMLITGGENLSYLCGFTGGSDGWLLIGEHESLLITDFRYQEQVVQEAPLVKPIIYRKERLKALVEQVKSLSLKHLGFEGEHITYHLAKQMTDALGDISFMAQIEMIEELRVIKEPEELEVIRKAVAVADASLLEIYPLLQPGRKEAEVALELEYVMRKKGGSGTSFETIVASGSRSSLPHGIATSREMQPGDLVTIDYGTIYNGYCSDTTRTFLLNDGESRSKKEAIYRIVKEAQQEAVQQIKAGMTCREIDAVARNIIESYGYGEYFGHGLGHGVGSVVHEKPSLSPRSDQVLVPGMVVTIEPGIYLPNFGGVRIEDMVLIRESGREVLTNVPKQLIIC